MIDRFAQPWLLLLLVLPVLVLLVRACRGGAAFGAFALAATLRPSRGPGIHRALIALGLTALVVAAARPQSDTGQRLVERIQPGRDLMLVIDLLGSMRLDDLDDGQGGRSDRLAAVMRAAADFVRRRSDDRIGLVFFSDRAVTGCPLTYDHATVLQFLERTEALTRAAWNRGDDAPGLLGQQTNLGLGVAVAARQLAAAEGALGRAAILVTDGVDTRRMHGWVDPLAAARQAAAKGVRVHGIGVGNPAGTITATDAFGGVRAMKVRGDMLPDLERLKQITRLADGEARAATDAAGLDDVFRAIEALEPTPRSVRQQEVYAERWRLIAAIGLALIALAWFGEPRLRGVA